MLGNRSVSATIPAADMDRAIKWYGDKLGLKPRQRMDGGAVFEMGGGSSFFVYPTPNAGKAPQTVMSFDSKDVPADVRALKARGVVFEEYDMPGLKTVDSVATMGPVRAAWFRDSEGNILALSEMPA